MESAVRTRSERLEARINSMQKDLLTQAAALEGRTVTDFVVSHACDAALQTIREHEAIALTRRDQEAFAQALLAPAEPTDALRRAFARHRELLG
ncbi:MAG: DUF1778 domain-containing protein [Lautropia sp.]